MDIGTVPPGRNSTSNCWAPTINVLVLVTSVAQILRPN